MRNWILTIILLLFAMPIFAQHNVIEDIPADKPSPWTIGIIGHGYFPTSANSHVIGNGGGVGITSKANINKYFAIQTNIIYTYATTRLSAGRFYTDTALNVLTFDSLLMLQYETARYTPGFVPWVALGIGVDTARYSAFGISDSGVGVHLNVGGGLRYNFKKFYSGITVTYNHDIVTRIGDISGVKLNFEIGYRM